MIYSKKKVFQKIKKKTIFALIIKEQFFCKF